VAGTGPFQRLFLHAKKSFSRFWAGALNLPFPLPLPKGLKKLQKIILSKVPHFSTASNISGFL